MCPIHSPLSARTHTYAQAHTCMHMLLYVLLYSYIHIAYHDIHIIVCVVHTYTYVYVYYVYMYMYMLECLSWWRGYNMLPGTESRFLGPNSKLSWLAIWKKILKFTAELSFLLSKNSTAQEELPVHKDPKSLEIRTVWTDNISIKCRSRFSLSAGQIPERRIEK